MKQLMKSRLFLLLTDTSKEKITLSNLESVYEEFADKLLEKSQKEIDLARLYYDLSFLRLELVEMCSHFSARKGEKCIKFSN